MSHLIITDILIPEGWWRHEKCTLEFLSRINVLRKGHVIPITPTLSSKCWALSSKSVGSLQAPRHGQGNIMSSLLKLKSLEVKVSRVIGIQCTLILGILNKQMWIGWFLVKWKMVRLHVWPEPDVSGLTMRPMLGLMETSALPDPSWLLMSDHGVIMRDGPKTPLMSSNGRH